MNTSFKIKNKHFEGPLDLLLDLVEKRKLHISDISLASVTDEYIKHIEKIPAIAIADRAEFIVIAATLLLIKSRSLLPTLDLTDEEEGSIADLERRLKMLAIIREGSVEVANQFGKKMIFARQVSIKSPVFSPHETMTLEAVKISLEAIIGRFPKKETLQKATVRKVISLEEMIERLAGRIQSGLSLSFGQFSGKGEKMSSEKKVEVIVGFLAMLELVKQGILSVMQENHFEDIKMETTNVGTPIY
ncbi:MAG TPA: segregation/condensation protein A [Candidatus Paceibacterota bacterium]